MLNINICVINPQICPISLVYIVFLQKMSLDKRYNRPIDIGIRHLHATLKTTLIVECII